MTAENTGDVQDAGQETEQTADAVSGQENQETSETTETESDDLDGQVDGDVDTELKTVRKALDKRNRYINNQRNRIRALEAEVQKARESFTQNKTTAPEMEKFDSVIDYMRADQNYTLEQKLAEQAHKQELSYLESQQQAAQQAQLHEVAARMEEIVKSNPEVQQAFSSNAHIIQSMPAHIEKLMAEIDDAPAATYALAREGRLQSLYSMPEHLAAAHLVQAEIRGQQYLQQSASRPVQQAPKPLDGLKGRGNSTGKPLSERSGDELMKWLQT